MKIHTGVLPFSCGVCGRRFNRRDKLARHAKSHDEAARVSCPFKESEGCAMSFYRGDKLKEHVACVHSRYQRETLHLNFSHSLLLNIKITYIFTIFQS